MNRITAFIFCLCLLGASVWVNSEEAPADLILTNGTVITMDPALPKAEAIAVRGDRIVWLGDESEISKWFGRNTRVIGLKGAFVFPGLIDSHAHVTGLGNARVSIDLVGTANLDAVLEKVKEQVAKTAPGQWVQGRGWDQNDWPDKKFPGASDLDRVAPDHPVFLERIDGHAGWVNTQALKLGGVTAATKDPEGGKIHRDAKGNPTGILVDTAMDLVASKMKALSQEELIERTKLAAQDALSKGITMIHDAGSSKNDIDAWKVMAQKKELRVRIYSMVAMPSTFGEEYLKKKPQQFDPYLDIRSMKLVVDGAMGSRGAAMLEPYVDDPGNTGLLMWKEADLMRVLHAAKASGIQVGIHAIGNRANRMILDAYEKAGVKGLRWRIEHAQLLSSQDIPRFAKIDVIASMQPIHATSDMPWFADRVGKERTKAGAYVWRSLLNNKTIIAGGSDAPVEDINPLWGLYAAITRQDHKGKPDGGWLPEQRVSREEAIRMFTLDAAYAAFREKDLGTLTTGKLADMIVLPENLLTCDPKALIDMKVLYTIVGGQVRHQGK
ncbi:amidohydrolase [bacterium]|nr:amidohydrolase [bacterium]